MTIMFRTMMVMMAFLLSSCDKASLLFLLEDSDKLCSSFQFNLQLTFSDFDIAKQHEGGGLL